MMRVLLQKAIGATALLLLASLALWAQPLEQELQRIQSQLDQLEEQRQALLLELEDIKLRRVQRDLLAMGLPGEDYIMHSAMALSYAEPFEQARWVAHIILPDVLEGTVGRTNDFRPDPKVATGTAVEADYFLKYLQADSTYEYDGFGYDRGHLAPSADFRWSERALSESYFYSNMSPQVAALNRERWAELEAVIRGYLNGKSPRQLYVVTGPVLEEGLAVIERSVNKVAIPKRFFKVVYDPADENAIGFILPNEKVDYPLATFAVPVDQVEAITGLDFFSGLEDELEAKVEQKADKAKWLPEIAEGGVEPLYPPALPRNHFNTVQAKQYMGQNEEVTICGTVVGTRYSRSGNLWINLDKPFPNQVFSVFIRKKDLPNFPYDPKEVLSNEKACFTGKVENFSGTPTMNIEREEQAFKGVPEK